MNAAVVWLKCMLLASHIAPVTLFGPAASAKVPVDQEPGAVQVDRATLRNMLVIALRRFDHDPTTLDISRRYPQLQALLRKELEQVDEIYVHQTENEDECFGTEGLSVRWQGDPGAAAYVHLDNRRSEGVNICPFWNSLGDRSKMHTLAHEYAHVLGVDDEELADALATVVMFLNGQRAMVSKYTWQYQDLKTLWADLYTQTFRPNYLLPANASTTHAFRVPKALRSLKKTHLTISTQNTNDGFKVYCALEARQGLLALDRESLTLTPYLQTQSPERVYRAGLQADNMSWFCTITAPVALSHEMLDQLSKEAVVTSRFPKD